MQNVLGKAVGTPFTDSVRFLIESVRSYESAEISRHVSSNDGGMSAPTQSDYDNYMRDGSDAIEIIFGALFAAKKTSVQTILDLPCGFGRVMRHLIAAFPEAEIVGCDIEQEMIDFCAKEFGAAPVLSSRDFDEIRFPAEFDLIWCGSLLSHLPEAKFKAALRLFSRTLSPDGIAVISTHGRYSSVFGSGNYLPTDRFLVLSDSYRLSGFGYSDYSDQVTQHTQNYGITLSSPSYLLGSLESDLDIKIISFTERAWREHQDVVVFKKCPVMAGLPG